MRIEQPAGHKGSLRWMQRAVNGAPRCLQAAALPPLTWVSPLAGDGFAEYRDGDFLRRLGLGHLAPALSDFWPARGPQWDGLARFDGGVVLAEAKAHLREFDTPPSAAGPASARRIETAFARVQAALGITPAAPWDRTFYQYANRIAHLWWLRAQGINAHLVLIGFLHDPDLNGPATAADWHTAISGAEAALGLTPNPLAAAIHSLHPDVREL
jgi:hypothetical protein